jgi:hypothetical protein
MLWVSDPAWETRSLSLGGHSQFTIGTCCGLLM